MLYLRQEAPGKAHFVALLWILATSRLRQMFPRVKDSIRRPNYTRQVTSSASPTLAKAVRRLPILLDTTTVFPFTEVGILAMGFPNALNASRWNGFPNKLAKLKGRWLALVLFFSLSRAISLFYWCMGKSKRSRGSDPEAWCERKRSKQPETSTKQR